MPQPFLSSEDRKAVVSLSLDPKLIDRLSQTAHEKGITRSALAAEVLEKFLK